MSIINHNIHTLIKVSETFYFKINGKLSEYVMAKDLILKIICEIGTDDGAYQTMQFGGEA